MSHEVVKCGNQYVVLAMHDATAPPSDAWSRYIADYEAIGVKLDWGPELCGGIAVTDGGGPGPAQRRLVQARLIGSHPHIRGSVITSSTLVQGVVTALGWLGGDIKAFAPGMVVDALDHLRLQRSALSPILLAIERLSRDTNSETARRILQAHPAP